MLRENNILRWLFLLSITCFFLVGCTQQQECLETEKQDLEIIFKYDCFNWNDVDLTYLPFKNQSEFESTVRDYIKGITEYTGCEDWYLEYGENVEKCVITFKLLENISVGSFDNAGAKTDLIRKFSNSEISTTITFSKSRFESGMPFLPHELTHMIFNTVSSQSMCEGLCEYFNRKYAGENSEYFYVKCKSVNDFQKGYSEILINSIGNETAREYENLKAAVMDSVGRMEKGYPYAFSSTESSIWFALSESFVEYLIEQYGIEKFMDFYKKAETEEDYRMLESEGYDKIKENWIKIYNEYESEIDYEEYKKDVEDFFKRYHKE